jgi:adenylate cyclase
MHTFLFADLAGFTALTEAMGDQQAAEVARDFRDAARRLLPRYGAHEIKTIGTPSCCPWSTPSPAIELGVDLAEEVGGRHWFPSSASGWTPDRRSSGSVTGSAPR